MSLNKVFSDHLSIEYVRCWIRTKTHISMHLGYDTELFFPHPSKGTFCWQQDVMAFC